MSQANDASKPEPNDVHKRDLERSLKPGVAFAIVGAGATIATTLAIGFALASATAPPVSDPTPPPETSPEEAAPPRDPSLVGAPSEQPRDGRSAPRRSFPDEDDEEDDDEDDDDHHRHGSSTDRNRRGGTSTYASERPATRLATARRTPRLRTRSS